MKKILFGVAALGLLGLAGAGLGLKAQDTVEAKADDPKTYYLCGSFATDYSNYESLGSWKNVANAYGATDGSDSPLVLNFMAGIDEDNHADIFKFVIAGNWSDTLGYSNLRGAAAGCFGDAGSDNNIYCVVTGSYYVYVSGSSLYIDYADDYEFRFTGTSNSFGDGEAVTVNGDALSKSLVSGQKFRFKIANTWASTVGYSQLSDTFYKCFSDADDGDNNIHIDVAGDYKFSLRQESHSLFIDVAFADMSTGMVHVLDLNGNLLATNHNAYVFNAGGAGTVWPGASMDSTTGASHIFEYEYLTQMETIIFNDGTTQTNDLSLAGKDGKCLILSWDYEAPKWTSSTWVSLEAAKFIDNYMKFAVHHENGGEGTGLCASEGWYAAAKTAYGELSATAKTDVSGYVKVAERLIAWAEANGDTFTVTDGVGSFGEAKNVSRYETASSENNAIAIATVVVTATVLGAGAFFIARKRRAE